MAEHTGLGRRALLTGIGAGVASLAGCLDRFDDTGEKATLEITDTEQTTDASGDPQITVQYTAPEDVDTMEVTASLYRDDQTVRSITDYLGALSGGAGYSVQRLNAEFDEFEASIGRLDSASGESGDIEVDSTETVPAEDSVDILVDFVSPDGPDRVDIAVDMFDYDINLPRGLYRTVTEHVHLDGESAGTVTHPVTVTSGWDDFSVRIDET